MADDSLGERFRLPAAMHQAIVAHAQQEWPRECCGVITGHNGLAEQLHALRNIAEGNRFYEIDPLQLMELEFQILPADESEIVSIYHSHPESVAYPSKTDLEYAYWPEAIYLICSLENRDQPYIRGFRLRDGAVTEVALGA